ncbi:transposase [Alloscardovia omnicolens]
MVGQNRPLDVFYPIVYLDAIMVKIRGESSYPKSCSSCGSWC